MSEHVQVAVVGGGITGLTLAHGLSRRGVDVRLFEAEKQTGGAVQTVMQDGFVLEQGPFTVMLRSHECRDLLDEVELAPVEVEAGPAKKRYVLWDGKLHQAPSSPGGLLTTSLLTARGKAAVLAGIFKSPPRPADADETMWQVAARRLGREAADRLAGPGAVGVFAAEARELSFDSCVPILSEADREAGSIIGMMRRLKELRAAERNGRERIPRKMISFDGGLQALTDRLTASLGEAATTQKPVREIARDGDGFRLVFDDGELSASAVATAAPAPATAALVKSLAPEAAAELSQIRSAGLGVVHLAFRRDDVEHDLDGFGFLAPETEDLSPVLGALWPSSVFLEQAPEGTVLVRAMVGGTRWPDALDQPLAELEDAAYQVLKPILGFRSRPLMTQSCVWKQSIPVYAPGHRARVERIQSALDGVGMLWGAGNWTGGLGVNDRVAAARALAERIAQSLQ